MNDQAKFWIKCLANIKKGFLLYSKV